MGNALSNGKMCFTVLGSCSSPFSLRPQSKSTNNNKPENTKKYSFKFNKNKLNCFFLHDESIEHKIIIFEPSASVT